ncbi:unnamed protein product, partial [marine sediment metagenome]
NTAQQHRHVDECDSITSWSVLNVDTVNLETTTNHVFGTLALEFDKINGAADSVIAGIQKTLSSISFSPYEKGGGFFLTNYYISDITNIAYAFLRLGTDSSNYNEWRIGVDNLSDGWNAVKYSIASPDVIQGDGWNSAAVTYVAVGVIFLLQNNELENIGIDHVSVNTGLLTSADITATVTSEVSSPNINLHKVGNKVVDKGAGDVGTGTQRITIAGDDVNLAAIKSAVKFSGAAYSLSKASTDTATLIEASAKLCRDVVIRNSHASYEVLLGNDSTPEFELGPKQPLGFTKIDLNTLYLKSKDAG